MHKGAKDTNNINSLKSQANEILSQSKSPGINTTLSQQKEVYSTAFHLVMNIVGADLKEDLISKLKSQGLPFDRDGNPQMSLKELESGLQSLLGGGAELITRYIRAEMQMLK